jgi:hypothetical protein
MRRGRKTGCTPEPNPAQMHSDAVLSIPATRCETLKRIAAHTRRTVQKDGAQSGEELKFFDESKLPVESIVLVHEEAQDLATGEFELIGEKITYRLPQLCDFEVPSTGDAAQGQSNDLDRAGARRLLGGQPRGFELGRSIHCTQTAARLIFLAGHINPINSTSMASSIRCFVTPRRRCCD